MSRDPQRASITDAARLAESYGYAVRETDCRDIDGTVSLDLSGFGELIELTYREHPATGYLRWHRGFIHNAVNGDRIPTWREARLMIVACARQSDADNEGAPQ